MAKRSSNQSCELWPEVNGKPSIMYKELLAYFNDRPVTNYLYSKYISSNAADILDQQMERDGRTHKYIRDSNGQHSAKDFINFFGYAEVKKAMQPENIRMLERKIGALEEVAGAEVRKDFLDAKEALKIADDFNTNDPNKENLVAYVVNHSNVYNIYISSKNSYTHLRDVQIKTKLKAWELCEQAFNNIGTDINNVPDSAKNIFSAFASLELPTNLKNIKALEIKHLSENNIITLLSAYINSRPVQNVINSYGSIEAAAQDINTVRRRGTGFQTPQEILLLRAIMYCQNDNSIDLDALNASIQQLSGNLSTQEEVDIQQTIDDLNKKYKINTFEFVKLDNKIRSYLEAVEEAILLTDRQRYKLERKEGITTDVKELDKLKNELLNSLATQKYYRGLLETLQRAEQNLAKVDNILARNPNYGNDRSYKAAFEIAKDYQEAMDIITQYEGLVTALSNKSIRVETSIPQNQIDDIREIAGKLKDMINKQKEKVLEWKNPAMINLVLNIEGDTTLDGQSLVDIVTMMDTDLSIINYLYSMGTSSNYVVAAMGTIIQDAKNDRYAKFIEYRNIIRKETYRLHKSGSSSKFIYEDDRHIISIYDWKKYDEAKKRFIKSLYRRGLKPEHLEFREELNKWVERNTEEIVVDKKNGRTERVPNNKYRKPFPQLTPAQQRYYDKMMEIKAEMGSLLPKYAQHQFLPPQRRRNMVDALSQAKNPLDVLKAFKRKLGDYFVVREDDTDYGQQTGIINYQQVYSDYDNTPLNEIPIFCINRVEEGELLKDFSSGLQAFVSTALTYEALNDIRDVVEFMADFEKDKESRDPKGRISTVKNDKSTFHKILNSFKKENHATQQIIDGYMDYHLFQNRKVEEKILKMRIDPAVGTSILWQSVKNLSTNVIGMVSNVGMGVIQAFIESGTNEFYNPLDLMKAIGYIFGTRIQPGAFFDLVSNNKNNMLTLLVEKFDPSLTEFEQGTDQRYHYSLFRKFLSRDLKFIGYEAGEYILKCINLVSMLFHKKVLINGKKRSLIWAFKRSKKEDGNRELVLKPNVTDLDGSPLTDFKLYGTNGRDKFEDRKSLKGRIQYCNQSCNGAMDEGSKGLIVRYCAGRSALNFRQWMIAHVSKRYRFAHFDSTIREHRRGYQVSVYQELIASQKHKDEWANKHYAKVIASTLLDLGRFLFRLEHWWPHMSMQQKYNCRRAATEWLCWALLSFVGINILEDIKDKYWARFWLYIFKRMNMEMLATMPRPEILSNALNVLSQPMANIQTFETLLYATTIPNPDWNKKISRGRYAGRNKYLVNLQRYMFPYFKDRDKLEDLENDKVFTYFETHLGRNF